MKDGFIIIGLIVLLFVVWVASGGPARPISYSGPYLNPITQTGTTAQAYGNPSQYSPINSTISIGGSGIGVTSNTKSVTLSRDTAGIYASDADEEYVVINVSAGATGSFSTAGWRLVSAATGRALAFPQGTEAPQSGHVNALSPIVLKPGDEAIVVTGRSPVGISFRENECTGYLEEHQDFHPSLSLSCPTPLQELSQFYPNADDMCVAAIRTVAYCGTEAQSSFELSSGCQNFMDDHLNYNGCIDSHHADANFAGHTWRIFLGSSGDLYRNTHDTVTLLDAQGKAIDSLTY